MGWTPPLFGYGASILEHIFEKIKNVCVGRWLGVGRKAETMI
jgi:hypothetical protein